jgi:exopolysaccharide biosynthesis polyprenyl glycosylphosphotransferase
LLRAVVLSFGLLLAGSAVYPDLGFGAGEIVVAASITLALVSITRYLYERATKSLYAKSVGQMRALLVGDGESRERVLEASERSPGAYNYVGELEIEGNAIDLSSLRRALDQTHARQVIVTGAERLGEKNFMGLIRSCRLRRVEVNVVPGAVALVGGRLSFSQEVGVPLLRVEYPTLDNYQRVLKRGLDVFGSLFGLLAISPLLLFVAAAIKFTSPGPVLFTQRRVGVDEKVFLCYKFRSMYQDAEQRQKELEALNEVEGAIFKIQNDPRITPIGHFIRRFSIDELPQLINVLKGEMSLVGPRPLPVRDFELMSEEHKRRLGAMPGMTGYWQISGRSDLSFEEMVRLDLYYIENWSLSFDVKIIARTVGTVLRQDGAY